MGGPEQHAASPLDDSQTRGGTAPSTDDAPPLRSLQEDVEALIEDGKTYFQAEVAFQKARAAFLAEEAKRALVLGVVGALFASLTLIGLTVGIIVALAPLVGPWTAVAIVVAALALCTFLALWKAQGHWKRLMGAMLPGDDGTSRHGDSA